PPWRPARSHSVALWRFLRRRQRLGFKFRRQHPIHRWIVDFYCVQARLAIEVDGPRHQARREVDLVRDRNLERCGILVLRLKNELVLRNIDSALGQIEWALTAHTAGRRVKRNRTGTRSKRGLSVLPIPQGLRNNKKCSKPKPGEEQNNQEPAKLSA